MPRRKQPVIPDELLDQLLGGTDPRAALADGGLLDGLKKALAERVLNAEMDHHLDGGEPDGRPNGRNGYGAKTVLTGTGKLDLQIPRDRLATFDPQLIAKYQRRFPGFDERIVSMYARGMSTREIQGHLREIYGLEVSPDLVSAVTDAVLEEVAEWQNRPLEAPPGQCLSAIDLRSPDRRPGEGQAAWSRPRCWSRRASACSSPRQASRPPAPSSTAWAAASARSCAGPCRWRCSGARATPSSWAASGC